MDLFEHPDHTDPTTTPTPLAERIRPHSLDEFVGQEHLLGPDKPLRVLIEQDQVPSMIFWGPPGSGKTTLARIIARQTDAAFHQLSAVSSGVRDIRRILEQAGHRHAQKKRTILFIDEIHRFNKAQQDALLHSVEDGRITLVGATTENPSFEVIPPLLSRCRVYVLRALGGDDLQAILDRAMYDEALLSNPRPEIRDRDLLIHLSGGDARRMLNGLETAVRLAAARSTTVRSVGKTEFEEAFQQRLALYDKGGEEHYNVVSAFIKSVRGSDPDAAVYWLARMLEGGEDPKFIARRMIILASEDIGNADPYALTLATSCFTSVDYVGMPEARIVLAQTTTYLASCPKSNASYIAVERALEDVRGNPDDPVPLHLRNAPTGLMANLGYGREYKYSHDYEGHVVNQQHLPDRMKGKVYYQPTNQGREKAIRERLDSWRKSKPE